MIRLRSLATNSLCRKGGDYPFRCQPNENISMQASGGAAGPGGVRGESGFQTKTAAEEIMVF